VPAVGQEYRLEAGWPQLPAGMAWGGVISVDVDADGNIVVFRRAEPPILKFAPSGKLLASMGEGVILRAHGFDIDHDGNLWATDQRGQQLIKFSPAGEVLMTIGKREVAGAGPDTFDGPCDVTVADNGDIFIADGHGNSRVVKLAQDGTFIKAWGSKGAGPGEFNVPHSTAIDSRGRLFVADRSNNRIQIFDQNGKYLDSWTQFGSPSGIYISDDDTLYVADSGKGIAVGSARDGSVRTLIEGTAPEGVTADAAGNVYAAEPGGEILKKFARQ
jgi:streptogramin lyase